MRDSRLRAVFEMLGEAPLIADIGCDHGYLAAALLRENRSRRVIASDISPSSCEKAARLALELGLTERMKVCTADGLDPLRNEEPPYRIAISGMGGELIADIIEKGRESAEKAELIVMQPMRGEAELRKYLFGKGFGITDERVVLDCGRYYQVISARYGFANEIPEGFPKGFFRFGWVMAQKKEELLKPLLEHYLAVYEGELEKAQKRGKAPERLVDEIRLTRELITFMERNKNAAE